MTRIFVVSLLFAALTVTAVAQCDGAVHAGTYYVDNSCGTNGNGSSTVCGASGPFNSLANLQAKSGGYTAGNYICLKRGATFRESLNLPSSGSSSSHIVLDAYGTGNKPIIKGSNVFATWTGGSGGVYQATAASSVSLLWKDGVFQYQGDGPSVLNNHEWYWTGGVLYYREDEADMGAHVIEGSVRSTGIYNNSQSNWDLNNLRLMHSDSSPNGYAFRLAFASGFTINDCEVFESRALTASSVSSLVVNRCVFKYSRGGSYWPQFWLDGSSTGTVNNSIFRGTDPGQPSVQLTSTASANIYNSIFDEYGGNAILSSSSGASNILNSVFTGGVAGWGNETMKNNGPGIVNVDYSLILPYGEDVRYFLTGITEGSHNLYVAPRFRGSVAKGYLVVGSDDTGWYPYFDEASRMADQYGYKVGFAVVASDLPNMPDGVTTIQNAINRGHWISNHSNSHAELSLLTGLTIQYMGSGTSATMSIGSKRLTTQVVGAPADNLNLDLTNSLYGTVIHLCDYLNNSTHYSCTGTDYQNCYTASVNLADVSQVNISSSAYAAVLDQTRYLTYEVDNAHTALTAAFKNPDGTPYSLDTYIYPFGMNVEDAAIPRMQALNYLGSRSTFDWLAYPYWRTSIGIDLFEVMTSTSMNSLGELAYVFYNPDCSDLSGAGRTFTCNNVSFSSNVSPIAGWGAASASFNGTSSYATNSDPTIDFHRGDGYWSGYINPRVLNAKQTLFYHGTDANNFHTLYLSSSGTVVYSIVAAGTEKVHVESPAGLLAASAWQRVTLTFNQNTFKLFIGAPEVVSVNNATRPAAYTGPFLMGAGGSGALQNYYSGLMSGVSFGTNSFAAANAFLNTLSSQGGVLFLYGHGDPGFPVPVMRVIFQAKKASSANVMLDSFHNVLADLRANATVTGNRFLTWLQPDGSDYHLLPDSPLINAGTSTGAPPTDFAGNTRSGATDIGLYELINAVRRSHSNWW